MRTVAEAWEIESVSKPGQIRGATRSGKQSWKLILFAIAAVLFPAVPDASAQTSRATCLVAIARAGCSDAIAMYDESPLRIVFHVAMGSRPESVGQLKAESEDKHGPADANRIPCRNDPKAARKITVIGPKLNESSGLNGPNTTLTIDEVNDLAGGHPEGAIYYGLTRRRRVLDVDATITAGVAPSGDGICMGISTLELEYGLIHVFIANELAPNGCAYRAAWRHELGHVKKYHELDRQFRSAFVAAVRGADVPSEARPRFYADLESAKREIALRIGAAIDKVLGITSKIRTKAGNNNYELWYGSGNPFAPGTYYNAWKKHLESWDSEAEYDRLQAECSDWPE